MATASMTIREAAAVDADAIADLIVLNDPRDMVSEISRDERRDRFHDGLTSGGIASFVAEVGAGLVGELTLALRHPDPTELGSACIPTGGDKE
jgi:hypothetical protein